MKKIIPFLVFAFFVTTVSGQKLLLNKADKQFDNFAYAQAIKSYLTLNAVGYKDSSYVHGQLAQSFHKVGDYSNALIWYEKWVSIDSVDPIHYYHYAQILRTDEQYASSEVWIKKYDALTKNKLNINLTSNTVWRNDSTCALELETDLNSSFSDYGIQYAENGVAFTSSRTDFQTIKRKHAWNEQPFLDLYLVNGEKDDNGDFIHEFGASINSKSNEGAFCFSEDFSTLYFTRNNSTNKIQHLNIFFSKKKEDGSWDSPESFEYNHLDYSVGHPSISTDGKKLYFTSDMPGGFGGTDLYFSEKNADESWTIPRNAGSKINTIGNEKYPSFHKNGILFFASDGHVGRGGLDIFAIQENQLDQYPKNLGSPINSKSDDFSFVLHQEKLKGYIASNRDGGMGGDDIYSFTLKDSFDFNALDSQPEEEEETAVLMDTTILSENLDSILFTNIDLDNSMLIEDSILKENKTVTTTIKEIKLTHSSIKDAVTPSGQEIVLDGIYFGLNSANLAKETKPILDEFAAYLLQNSTLLVELSCHTDSRGSDQYNYTLSGKRAKSAHSYLISKYPALEKRLSAKGYGETKLLNKCKNGVKCIEIEHKSNRRMEYKIIGSTEQ